MEPRKDDKSLGELFSELSRDTAELVRKEVELARTELTARASRVGRHVVYIAIGGFIAYAGVLALVAALVIVLEVVGLTWWASALIVGIVTGSIVVGSILLAPSIVLGYAVKAAEKEDRAQGR